MNKVETAPNVCAMDFHSTEIMSTESGEDKFELPSIFELVAQDSLMNSLRPALHYLVKYLTAVKPQHFGSILRYYDEAYAGFELFLQSHCLKKYGASFSEHFYGLKRVTRDGQPLPTASRLRSLAVLVLVPYIRLKLDQLYKRLREDRNLGRQTAALPSMQKQNSVWQQRLLDAFLTTYPLVSGAIELAALGFQMSYLISKSKVHSPWLYLAGVNLVSLSSDDLARMNAQLPSLSANPRLYETLLYYARRLSSATFHGASKLLGLLLFFLQFLDYWYAQEGVERPKLNFGDVVVPPAPQRIFAESAVLKMDPGLCPICRKARKGDTVLIISGYVFCYTCIYRHLQACGTCPVTKLPASTDQLVRLYIDPA